MGRSRMFTDEEPESGLNPSPRTTIVGGRPPDPNAKLPPVPTGIQRLLRLAAVNDAFRAELIEKRGAVADAAGVHLNVTEAAILSAISPKQLGDMVASLPPPTADRRDFLRQTAASAAVLLGGATLGESLSGCDQPRTHHPPPAPTSGSTFAQPPPDEPEPPRPDYNDMNTEGGIAPDEPPPPRPDVPAPPTGIMPDMPPPNEHQPTRGIRPDVPPPRAEDAGMRTKGGSKPDMPPE